MKKYVVITGASQGLGKAFAHVCARRGYHLILISLPNESIEELAELLIINYNVEVLFYETDLTKNENIEQLVIFLKNYEINILINNAGLGGTKKFNEVTVKYIDNILLLNMRSLVVLTHQLLPILKQQKETYILNISSLAAFSPMPFKTIYPASKSFVYSFSRGLNAELQNTNVHVAVAHPGGMATNKEVSARINKHKGLIKRSILTPEQTAEICLRKLLQKVPVIIPGKVNRFSSVLQRILPVNMQLNMMKKKLQKELE